MRYSLLLIAFIISSFLIASHFLPISHEQGNGNCDVRIISSNSTIIGDLNFCKLVISNNSVAKIIQNTHVVVNYLIVEGHSTLLVINSSIIITSNFSVANNSQIIFQNSKVFFGKDPAFPFKGSIYNSTLTVTKTVISSSEAFIDNNYSKIYSVNNTFGGMVVFKAKNHSNLNFFTSNYFYLGPMDNSSEANIKESLFSLFIDYTKSENVTVELPEGFVNYWNGSIAGLGKVNIKANSSYISPPNYPNILNIATNGNLTVYNATNLDIWLNDFSFIQGLGTGYFSSGQVNLTNSKIYLYKTWIKDWKIIYEKLSKATIQNSKSFNLLIRNNMNIFLINDKINSLYSTNSSIIYASGSTIDNVFLYNYSSLFLSNSFITNFQNVHMYGNSTIYISNISDIKSKLIGSNGKVNILVYGMVNVISQNPNVYITFYKLTIRMLVPNSTTYTIAYGNNPVSGLIVNFTNNRIPSSYYIFSLEVYASNNVTLRTTSTIYIFSDIGIPVPNAPILNYTIINNSVLLKWSINTSPFLPISGFYILKGDSPFNMKVVATVPTDVQSYLDENVTFDKDIYYAIVAYNVIGNSTYSNIIHVYIPITNKNNNNMNETLYNLIQSFFIISVILIGISFVIKKYRK